MLHQLTLNGASRQRQQQEKGGTAGPVAQGTISAVRFSEADLRHLGYDGDDIRVPTRHIHLPVGDAGRWTSAFVVGIEGPVRSKSNYRRGGGRNRQRWGQVVEFETRVRDALQTAKPEDWPDATLDTSLADRPQIVTYCLARTILDASNLSKSVLDAAEGVLYPNDAAVRGEYSQTERGTRRQLLVCGFAAYDPADRKISTPFAVAAELAVHVEAMYVSWEFRDDGTTDDGTTDDGTTDDGTTAGGSSEEGGAADLVRKGSS